MKPISPTSQIFAPDQQYQYVVSYWDTPMTPLRNDIASNGLRMDVVEPTATGLYDFPAAIRTVAASGVADAWTAAQGERVLTDGRVANLIGYWAGGAPGYHGATKNRQVGYKFEGTFRTATGRDWFSAAEPVTQVTFAVAGSGYVRIIKNNTTDLFNGIITEEGYLNSGPSWATTTSLAAGDTISVYYVQDKELWGGFVVKAYAGALPAESDRAEVFQQAPVVGAGLLGTGTNPPKKTLEHIESVEVTNQLGQTRRATLRVPLVVVGQTSGLGWQWVRTGGDVTGHLLCLHSDGSTTAVYRQRLIQIQMGFRSFTGVDELYTAFTGWIDDFAVSDGLVTITCLGVEQRVADQYVRNYPDRISYMCAGYTKTEGTTDPVYAIAAYDNWNMELALRDLLIRCGIDESRTRATLTVPQANGTAVPVVM